MTRAIGVNPAKHWPALLAAILATAASLADAVEQAALHRARLALVEQIDAFAAERDQPALGAELREAARLAQPNRPARQFSDGLLAVDLELNSACAGDESTPDVTFRATGCALSTEPTAQTWSGWEHVPTSLVTATTEAAVALAADSLVQQVEALRTSPARLLKSYLAEHHTFAGALRRELAEQTAMTLEVLATAEVRATLRITLGELVQRLERLDRELTIETNAAGVEFREMLLIENPAELHASAVVGPPRTAIRAPAVVFRRPLPAWAAATCSVTESPPPPAPPPEFAWDMMEAPLETQAAAQPLEPRRALRAQLLALPVAPEGTLADWVRVAPRRAADIDAAMQAAIVRPAGPDEDEFRTWRLSLREIAERVARSVPAGGDAGIVR